MQACAKCLACIKSLDPMTVVTPMLEMRKQTTGRSGNLLKAEELERGF